MKLAENGNDARNLFREVYGNTLLVITVCTQVFKGINVRLSSFGLRRYFVLKL